MSSQMVSRLNRFALKGKVQRASVRRRQSVAQGGASKARGTLGNVLTKTQARFSGRQTSVSKLLPPAKAGLLVYYYVYPGLRFVCPGLHSGAIFDGSSSA